MWDTAASPVPIFEDENEAELIKAFVEMSARYPQYPSFAICQHIFRDLRDPGLRANQAALQWSQDLVILERIRQAKLNGNREVEALTKEALQAKIFTTIEDETLGSQEKKVRLEGYMNIAELHGWKIKAVEKKSEDVTRRFPVVRMQVYPDAA